MDVPKTTFFTMFFHYEFLVILFELNNAHVGFRELMTKVFRPYLDFFIISFDEIYVYSWTKEDYVCHLKIVFWMLREKNFYEKFSKCDFLLDSMVFLEYVVSNEVIRVVSANIKAIRV